MVNISLDTEKFALALFISLLFRQSGGNHLKVGCCGADGPNDYMNMRKPLPAECRDTVTGNAFYYGCVEELTWYLEEKSGWLAGITMAACMLHVINGVLSLILIQAVKKEEDDVAFKR